MHERGGGLPHVPGEQAVKVVQQPGADDLAEEAAAASQPLAHARPLDLDLGRARAGRVGTRRRRPGVLAEVVLAHVLEARRAVEQAEHRADVLARVGALGGHRAEPRRRERGAKKPPVPVLPDGTWVQIGDSCRSSTLQGQVGTVVAWGRQVEVLLRRPDGAEGDVRKINPPALVALREEPGFTAAEEADDRSIRDSGDTTSSD